VYSKQLGSLDFLNSALSCWADIIRVERNFTNAQNFGHSGKTLMLEKIPDFFFTGCMIKCRADWGFLFCPIILGIKVERLERSHFCPKSHARWKDN
jgi:hypothetical protein